MRKTLVFLFVSCLFELFFACKYESIQPMEVPIATDSCSWDQISYQKVIAPIVATSCVASVCHNNGSAPRGIGLDGHFQLSSFVKSDSARFLGVIRQVGLYSYMPLGRPKLDDCTIRKLESWIRQGAQNN